MLKWNFFRYKKFHLGERDTTAVTDTAALTIAAAVNIPIAATITISVSDSVPIFDPVTTAVTAEYDGDDTEDQNITLTVILMKITGS